jgi:transcriptional regulator with XRE-family HTH domain
LNNSILKAFGIRIKTIRLQRGLSQEQLGLIAELDRTYISGIERGLRNVSLINLERLAIALNTEPSQLLKFDEPNDV